MTGTENNPDPNNSNAASVKDKAKDAGKQAKDRASQAASSARHSAEQARDYTAERYQSARDYTSDRYRSAKDKASEGYQSAREYSSRRYADARQGVGTARERAERGIQENPLALAGLGLLAGMAVGLLLPRTRQENRYLGGYRDDLFDQAREAAHAARLASEEELRGIADQAKAHARELGDQAVDAAKHAGEAARKHTDV